MTFLKKLAAVASFAYIGSALAQTVPDAIEPLPSDSARRIYYGEHYDPARYAKCRKEWQAKGGDPRVDGCSWYKERIPPLDPSARDHFGEFYDPKKYHDCRSHVLKNDMRCEYLKLRRITQRAIWPYPDVPELKLPAAPNSPVYKRSMSAKQYFDALCKAEAGEFIYRAVNNVEGVYQIRPRARASQYALYDRYVLEDPYGRTQAEAENAPQIFLGPKNYRFFEVPIEREHIRDKGLDGKYFDASIFLRPGPGDKVARYFGYDRRNQRTLKKEYDSKLKSHYGYTWRGIKRPKDREHGIAGGELIVVDLATNEILGIRRGFIRAAKSRYSHSGLTWETGEVCPKLTDRPGWPKDVDFTVWFVTKVVKPAAAREGENGAGKRQ